MNKRIIAFGLILFLLSTCISIAQNGKGKVLDEKSNKPLSGINIFLKNTGVGTTTDEKGEFNLKYFRSITDKDTLYFSSIGYTTIKVIFSEFKTNGYSVLLAESVQLLNGVTIESNKLLKAQIAYTKLASLKDGVYSYGSVLADDKIWIIGGDETVGDANGFKSITASGNSLNMKSTFIWEGYSDKLRVYDIQSDKWTVSDLKFSKRAYHNANYFNDKLYILGGKQLSPNRKTEYLDDKIEVYDIKHNSILVDNTNPHQAVNFASFVYDNSLIVIGGSTKLKVNNEKEYSNKVHLLNLKTGYWYELADMPKAKETKGVLVDNILYLIGGFNLKPLTEIETYNIATAEWKVVGQLFYGVERPAVVYNDNIIYIFEDGRIQTYNIETKELNLYSIDLWLRYSDLFYENNKLYVLGGFQENEGSISPSINLYSIDLDQFKKSEIYNSIAF